MMPRRLPSLRALVAFEATVRLGGTLAAAAELGVTHGAVSKQLSLLEAELGRPLFRRARGRLLPTPAAEAFARALREGLDRIEEASEALRGEASGAEAPREVRVIAPAAFAMRWLIPRLHALQRDAGLAAVVRTTDLEEDWRVLPFDVAILRGDRPVPAGLTAVEAMREAGTLVMARGAARNLRRLTYCEAATRPGELDAWLRAAGADPAQCRDRRPFPRFYLALEAALAGTGALVAPLQLVADALRDGRLVAPFPQVLVPGDALRCLFDPAGPRVAEARAFAAWLARLGRKQMVARGA